MSTRDYQIGLVDAERKAQLLRRPETGFSKDTELILKTESGKYLFFALIMALALVAILVIALSSEDKTPSSNEDKYRNISLIVGYLIIGITIGRALYFYYHVDSAETVGAFLWYTFLWPVYIFFSGYKFLVNNDKEDIENIIKNFVGFQQLPPYPTGGDYIRSYFKIFAKLTIVISLALIINYIIAADKGLGETTVLHKDYMALAVVLVMITFIVITPDNILSSEGWQYRTVIFLTGFFFLYSLYLYYFAEFDDNDRKGNTFGSVVASGVLLFAVMIYYFMYNLPDDDKNRMLRGIFTDEQMNMINPALASQVKVLEQIVHNSDYFDDNGYFTSDPKYLAEIQKQFSPSVFNFIQGKNKDAIQSLIKELRKKFTAIYKAKLIYAIAMKKYNEKERKDSSIFKSFFNTPEFIALEQDSNPELNSLARKFKESTLASTAVGGYPPLQDYQALFGTQVATPMQEVVLPKSTVAAFESQIQNVDSFLQGAFNRAVLKKLGEKYLAFIDDSNSTKVGIKCEGFNITSLVNSITNIEITNSNGNKNKIKNINTAIIENSKKELKKSNQLQVIYENSLTIKASDSPGALEKMVQFMINEPNTKIDSILKELLGDKYDKPSVSFDIINERMQKDGIASDEVWNNKLLRNDIQKLGENRRKNAEEAFSHGKKFYKALSDLIIKYSQAAIAQDYEAYDLLKDNGVTRDIKTLNEGIGETKEFGRGIGDEIFSGARIESESNRKNIQQAYDTAKKTQESSEFTQNLDKFKVDVDPKVTKAEFDNNIKNALLKAVQEVTMSDDTKTKLGIGSYSGSVKMTSEKAGEIMDNVSIATSVDTAKNALKTQMIGMLTLTAEQKAEFTEKAKNISDMNILNNSGINSEINLEKWGVYEASGIITSAYRQVENPYNDYYVVDANKLIPSSLNVYKHTDHTERTYEQIIQNGENLRDYREFDGNQIPNSVQGLIRSVGDGEYVIVHPNPPPPGGYRGGRSGGGYRGGRRGGGGRYRGGRRGGGYTI